MGAAVLWWGMRRSAGAFLAGRVAPGFFSCISNVTRRTHAVLSGVVCSLLGLRECIDARATPGSSAPPPAAIGLGTERGDSGPLTLLSSEGAVFMDGVVGGRSALSAGGRWALTLYPDACEAGGSFRSALPGGRGTGGGVPDQERAREEAARRARAKVRRYCAANRLNRLGTLTYAGQGCHDPNLGQGDAAGFFKRLRVELGGKALPYLWGAGVASRRPRSPRAFRCWPLCWSLADPGGVGPGDRAYQAAR